jgi:Cof subfamily protein (haloacid dehalogenase superfamily)
MKIAFFDIDGTILDFGAADIHPSVKEALASLRRHGIKIFIATGRAPGIIPAFPDVPFDGIISFNGGYCYTPDEVICRIPMDHKDVQTVIQNAKNLGLPAMLANEKRMGANFYQKELNDYMQVSQHTCEIIADYDALSNDDIYQMMIGSSPEQDDLLLKNTSQVCITRWYHHAVDVIPSFCGKDRAIEKILSFYNFDLKDSIAFGDGGNDLSMIRYAGTGVAMGNAGDEVKNAANYVTDTCTDDGVVTALQHFHLI